MRDKILQWLALSMVAVEVLRGTLSVHDHLRMKAERNDTENGQEKCPRSRRARESAAFALVCLIAIIPASYYLVHAIPT